MRIFLISFPLAVVARELVARGFEIVYWTGTKEDWREARHDQKHFAKTIWHDSLDALSGIPAPTVDTAALPTSPQGVFAALAPITWQVLGMIDRADYSGLSSKEKLALYHHYVNYWYGALKQYQPEAVVFADVPHTGPNYVIYNLARYLGIKTLIYRRLKGFTDRILFFEDWQDYKRLRERYQTIKDNNLLLTDLEPEMRAYYQEQSASTQAKYSRDIETFVKHKYKYSETFPSLEHIFKNLIGFTFSATTFKYVRMLLHKRRVPSVSRRYFYGWQAKRLFHQWNKIKDRYRAEYYRLVREPDLSKAFVYLPLHFQPECNTNPLGGVFDDQLLMVEVLSKALPDDWVIYVKENPMQWTIVHGHFGRFDGYYERLSRLPRVSLVPTKISTYDLIDKSRAVATITGSAGWEAVLRGQSALVFGHAWYKDCAGVFRVNDETTARVALEKIRDGYRPDQQKVLAFLQALSEVSVKAYPDKRYRQFSDLDEDKNARTIAAAIADNLSLTS